MNKKRKKQIMDITSTSMMLGAGSMAVSSVGGNAAGIANIGSFMGATGSMVGIGMMMDSMPKMKKKRKRK